MQLLIQALVALLQRIVGLLELLQLLFHLLVGEQGLLIPLAYTIEILLQRTVVVEQLLLFVDTTLVVGEQLLLLIGLCMTSLHLEIESNAESDSD